MSADPEGIDGTPRARSDSETRVGLVQMTCGPDPEANVRRALEAVERTAAEGARIICTQELFRTRYFCQTEDPRNFSLAETIPGPTTERFGAVARRREVVVIVSLFERRAPGLYHNTAAVIDADGTLLGTYRKMHIPDDPRFHEKYYFTPGDLGFRVWETRYAKFGVLICWDQWFPEAARLTALQGAEILFFPTAIGWLPEEKAAHGATQHTAWETAQRAHAIANGCFVAAVNRVGLEQASDGKTLEFWGRSFVAGPLGEIEAKAGPTDEANVVVPVDLSRLDAVRTEWPFFRDRRTDAYGDIGQRFLASPGIP